MRKIALLILLTFVLGVYLTACFGSGLLDDADSGHAEISKEILERDNWVTLHMNGIRFLEKGPLLFWMGAISYQYLGVSALGARAVEVFCILGCVLLCNAFGATLAGIRAAFYAGLIFAASWGVFLFTRIFIPDILITLTIAAAMYSFWRSRQSLIFAYCFWAALAAAVLAKGLIGIVFPLGAIALYILITRRWRDVLTLRPLPGTLFFLLLAAPWHIMASLRTPKFAWFYFVNEHFLRFLGKRLPMDYD
jgi:4-amino-4-deoxy-L-arabinose transferase-like glycosyltransferase